jgi:hypothetical protein
MPSWVASVTGTFVLSFILAYGFLRLRCRGIGPPFGPRARYWAFFIVVATTVTSTGVGLLIVISSNHVPAYVAIIVPSGLWLRKLPPQRDRDMLPRSLTSLLNLPFSHLYDRMGDDMDAWCDTRLRATSPNPQWISDAAQYYYNQVASRPREWRARANLDRWLDSIANKISIVRLINLDADPGRLRAALQVNPSTQSVSKYNDADLPRLALRLETEALNELHLFLAYVYRLGYHKMLIYPFRPPLQRVSASRFSRRSGIPAQPAEPMAPDL